MEFLNNDSMNIQDIVRSLDEQPEKVYIAEKAAAMGKYILSMTKNAYEKEYNQKFLAEDAGKTVKDKDAYALEKMSFFISEEMNTYYRILEERMPKEDTAEPATHLAGNMPAQELLHGTERLSSQLFAKYHFEQNKLDVYRQKASLLKEMINARV